MKENISRICIVTTRNIFDAPSLRKYREIIKEPFDIIYWDRCDILEECGANKYFRYCSTLSADSGKLLKLRSYIGFIRHVNQILNKQKYEKLIVFPTQMGWLIRHKLCHEYNRKYIFDIRDYAGEKSFIIHRLTKSIVEHSGLCCITSPAYKNFLPERDYLISHNLQNIDQVIINQYRMRKHISNQRIVLSFIGSVRFIEQQKKLILLLKNDIRFELRFIGRGSEQLANFCQEERVENVVLVGRFEQSDLPKYYLETDIAINVYGNNDPYLDYALSNKLYSAAMMGMPILVSPGTYMEEVACKYGFGLAVDLHDKNTAEIIYEYYMKIDRKEMRESCDRFLKDVEIDETQFQHMVKDFLGGI